MGSGTCAIVEVGVRLWWAGSLRRRRSVYGSPQVRRMAVSEPDWVDRRSPTDLFLLERCRRGFTTILPRQAYTRSRAAATRRIVTTLPTEDSAHGQDVQ